MAKTLESKLNTHEQRLNAHEYQLDLLNQTNNEIKMAVHETATALNNQTSVLVQVEKAISLNSEVSKNASSTIKLVLFVLAGIVVSSFIFIAVIFGKVDGNNLVNKSYELGQTYKGE